MKVNLNEKYKTRDGLEAIIYSTTSNSPYSVHGVVKDKDGFEFLYEWNNKGSVLNSSFQHHHDLVCVRNYDHIKIDDKVIVWDDDVEENARGHFAGIDSMGNPQIWNHGKTSFTIEDKNDSVGYDYCLEWEEPHD